MGHEYVRIAGILIINSPLPRCWMDQSDRLRNKKEAVSHRLFPELVTAYENPSRHPQT
jgi:hypothetical protein